MIPNTLFAPAITRKMLPLDIKLDVIMYGGRGEVFTPILSEMLSPRARVY